MNPLQNITHHFITTHFNNIPINDFQYLYAMDCTDYVILILPKDELPQHFILRETLGTEIFYPVEGG
jgi:hypothetical protein